MGHIEATGVGHVLPDGRELFTDVSFRVGDGAGVALVGPDGAGKTTLLRMIAGEIAPASGSFARSGGLGVMGQFIGSIDDDRSMADLALSLAPPSVRAAGERLRTPRTRSTTPSAAILAVTHDRWFTRGFDRFVVFTGDGEVRETPQPAWE